MRVQTQSPKKSPPGIIDDVVQQVAKDDKKDYVLAIDGKKVAQGLTESYGDIDLRGYEKPSLKETNEQNEHETQLLASLDSQIPPHMAPDCKLSSILPGPSSHILENLQSIATAISQRIRDIRDLHRRQRFLKQKLEKLQARNIDHKDKYTFAISNTNNRMFRCRAAIKSGLNLNDLLCEIGSQLGSAGHMFQTGLTLDLNAQQNIVQLKTPEDLPNTFQGPEYIKQRTEAWFGIRKSAPVTGSTLHTALGLRQLKMQKQHIQVYKGNIDATPHTTEVLLRMKHGQENEDNAVATLAGKVIPFLFPDQCFYEEGCRLIPGREGGKPLLEVSADGTFRTHPSTVSAVIEIKCPVEVEYRDPVHYTVPKYYMAQMLSEMKAVGVNKGLYLSYSKASMTVLEVTFDDQLWEALFQETLDIYGKEDIAVPNEVREIVPRLKKMLDAFAEHNVSLLIEVPSMTVTQGKSPLQSTPDSPYLWPSMPYNRTNRPGVAEDLVVVRKRAEECFSETRLLCRKRATEVLTFAITDTDRIATPEQLHHMPIAYAMKGYSLPCSVLRSMCKDLKSKCVEAGINVVCESFDGQWHNLCVRGDNGHPLNRLELQKDVLRDVQAMSKGQQMTFLRSLYLQPAKDMDMLKTMCNDIEGKLYVRSSDCRMGSIITPGDQALWEKKHTKKSDAPRSDPCSTELITTTYTERHVVMETSSEDTHAEEVIPLDQSRRLINQDDGQIGRSAANREDLAMLENDLVTTCVADEVLDYLVLHDGDTVENYEGDHIVDTQPADINLLTENATDQSQDETLIPSDGELVTILTSLKQLSPNKWDNITVTKLRSFLDHSALKRRFTKKELLVVVKDLWHHDQIGQIKKEDKKLSIVNKLASIVGNAYDENSAASTRLPRRKNPARLTTLCAKVLNGKCYPKAVLNVALARYIYPEKEKEWESHSPVPMMNIIAGSCVNLFSYPDDSNTRRKIEPRVVDPSHLLVNNRSRILTRGIKGVNPNAFRKVCNTHPDVINKSLIVDIIDKQNVAYAQKFFRKKWKTRCLKTEILLKLNMCTWFATGTKPLIHREFRPLREWRKW